MVGEVTLATSCSQSESLKSSFPAEAGRGAEGGQLADEPAHRAEEEQQAHARSPA